MKIKGFRYDYKSIAFYCTMWGAIIGLVLMVGVAAMNSGA
jgi:hypothetical protein